MTILLRTSFILWLTWSFATPQPARAASALVVRHQKTSALDFQIYREMHSGLRTLPMEWDRRPSTDEKTFDSLELFRRLQETKLQRRINAALILQEDIWKLRFDDDWNPPLRSLFLEVGIDRALHEVEPELQRQKIFEALNFAISFEEVRALPQWKDPRVRTLLEVRWNARKLRMISLSHFRQLGFQMLRLNGVGISLETTTEIKLPDTSFRLTALSHHWSPWTKLMGTEKISQAEPELVSLVQGDCLNPQLSPVVKELNRTVHAVFDRMCTRIWNNDQWVPIKENVSTRENLHFRNNISDFPKEESNGSTSTLKKYGPPVLILGLLAGVVYTFIKSQTGDSNSNSREPISSPSRAGEVVHIPTRY